MGKHVEPPNVIVHMLSFLIKINLIINVVVKLPMFFSPILIDTYDYHPYLEVQFRYK